MPGVLGRGWLQRFKPGKKKMGEGGAFLYRKAGLLQGYYGGPAAKRESIGKGITFPDGKRGQDHPLRAA